MKLRVSSWRQDFHAFDVIVVFEQQKFSNFFAKPQIKYTPSDLHPLPLILLDYHSKMTTRIPTSTSITESSVIPAPLSQVWHLIKLQDFHTFWTKLSKSEHVNGASPETDIIRWTFKDGTEQEVKQEEHSVRLPPCPHYTG